MGIFSMRFNIGPILLMPLILASSEIVFKPFFPGFIGVAYEWFWFLIFFAIGFSCIVAKKEWYDFIETRRTLITALALLWTAAFVWIRLEQYSTGIAYVDGGWLLEKPHVFHDSMTLAACVIHSFHAWFWCLAVFAWGARLLNRPSMQLAYLNQGVYPFYIVHMPLVFAGLRVSSELGLRDMQAVFVATVFTVFTCWAFFEMVRVSRYSRFLFGIKDKKTQPSTS